MNGDDMVCDVWGCWCWLGCWRLPVDEGGSAGWS